MKDVMSVSFSVFFSMTPIGTGLIPRLRKQHENPVFAPTMT